MKIKLTRITRSYWVTDCQGKDFIATEYYITNPEGTKWEVISPDDEELGEGKKRQCFTDSK